MNLFIDTNIFVRFFDTTNESLSELESLKDALNTETWKLWLPDQVKREYWKNRTSAINQLIKDFEKSKSLGNVPLLIREDADFSGLKSLSRDFDKKKIEITRKIKKSIDDEDSQADVLIKDLFAIAEDIDTSGLFEISFERAQRHIPPGKKEDLGDRINWVGLLEKVPKNTDLDIISDDGDFEQSGELMPYLKHEWKQKNGGKLRLWKRLSQFIAAKFSDATHAINEEQEIHINRLRESENFATTHDVINKFPNLKYLNNELAEMLYLTIVSNSQVKWIASDSDIREFIEGFKTDADSLLSESQKTELQSVIDDN